MAIGKLYVMCLLNKSCMASNIGAANTAVHNGSNSEIKSKNAKGSGGLHASELYGNLVIPRSGAYRIIVCRCVKSSTACFFLMDWPLLSHEMFVLNIENLVGHRDGAGYADSAQKLAAV